MHPPPSSPPPPPPPPPTPHGLRRRLGLPVVVVVGLAMLSVPRVFAHDLGLDGGPLPAVLTLGPVVVWVVVVLWARVPSPLVTLLAVGAVYGLALGVVHNILWDEAFDGSSPELGNLDPETAEVPLRFAAFVSSLFTGIMVGLICGLVATAVRAGAARSRR